MEMSRTVLLTQEPWAMQMWLQNSLKCPFCNEALTALLDIAACLLLGTPIPLVRFLISLQSLSPPNTLCDLLKFIFYSWCPCENERPCKGRDLCLVWLLMYLPCPG